MSTKEDIAQAEYEQLLREARDNCARRTSSATSISASDSALRDLAFQKRRIDALSTEKLVELAAQRAARNGDPAK